jgi:hypothetical protein
VKIKTTALLIAGMLITAGAAIAIATPASFKSNLAKGYLWDDSAATQSQPSEDASSDVASNSPAQPTDTASPIPDNQEADLSSNTPTTAATAETPASSDLPSTSIDAQQPDPSANSPIIAVDAQGANPSVNSVATKPTREEFVQFAKDEMNKGLVAASTSAGVDGSDFRKREFRQGWERLDQYFELAYGGRFNKTGKLKYDQDVVKYITTVKKTTTDKDGNVVTKDVDALQSWCGIFALWALKSKGLATQANWVTGIGFEGLLHQGIEHVDPSRIQIGDIGVLVYDEVGHRVDHHFIISEMQNGKITGTINGNGKNAMVSPGDGSRVNEAIEAQAKDPSKQLVSFYTAF